MRKPSCAGSASTPAGPRADPRLTGLWVCLALAAAIAVVFWPVTRCAFLNYDDDLFISGNPFVQGGLAWEGVRWAFSVGLRTEYYGESWIPVTFLSHMAVAQFFGMEPFWHHLANLGLHVLNALLLFLALRKLSGSLWASAFTAAAFGLHPLHVESVAWVMERKDLLCAAFWFALLWSHAGYAARPSPLRALRSAALLALGLWSKPMLVTAPIVLLLLDYWPLGRLSSKEESWARVREKLPLFALAAGAGILAFLANLPRSVSSLEGLPLRFRLENAAVSLMSYLGKTLWPADLAILYPHPGGAIPLGSAAGAAIAVLAVTVGVFRLRKSYPFLLTGWLWYVATLLPVIGLVQVGEQGMADRYSYVPLVGVFIMAAWGAARLAPRPVLWTLAAGALAASAAVTSLQLRHWRDSEAVFRRAVAVTAGNGVAHNNLGLALAQRGRLDEAVVHYTEALRIKPGNAQARNNLGNALADRGRTSEAIAQYREALRSEPKEARFHNNLGLALAESGKPLEAVAEYQESLRLNPKHANAHNNLGLALSGLGRFDEADAHFSESLRLNPSVMGYNNWGLSLAQRGRPQEAVSRYQAALRLRPDPIALHNLGLAWKALGDRAEAVACWAAALRLNPSYVNAHINLADALEADGGLLEAAAHVDAALRLQPGNAQARAARARIRKKLSGRR